MYPPLKEIYDKYPAYLEENRDKISDEDRTRYEKQFEVSCVSALSTFDF